METRPLRQAVVDAHVFAVQNSMSIALDWWPGGGIEPLAYRFQEITASQVTTITLSTGCDPRALRAFALILIHLDPANSIGISGLI
jgi:hypothetical protein